MVTSFSGRVPARVLVVDDDHDVLELMAIVLGRDGHGVQTADNGEAALRFLAGEVYDLVILDRRLPDVDGFELVRRCRDDSRLRDVPVVMVSGMAQEADVREGLDAGVDHYLTKPFTIRGLLDLVNATLGRGGAVTPTS